MSRWLGADVPDRHGAPQIAALSPETIRAVSRLATFIILALAAFGMWRIGGLVKRPKGADARDARIFAAALLLAITLSPLLRQYYLVWAIPALFALATESRNERLHRSAVIMIGVWTAGMLAWLSPALRASGIHLAMLLVMLGMLLTTRMRTIGDSPFEPAEDDAGVVTAEAERV